MCFHFISPSLRKVNIYHYNMIEGRDIVVFGLQSWDLHIATTIKYTALEFSKKNRVLFVNPPLQRSLQLLHRDLPEVRKALKVLKKEEDDLVRYNDNLWVLYPRTVLESINWIKNHRLFNYFNKLNDKRFARQISKSIDRLNFRNFILFNDCLLYTSPSPRDGLLSRMPSSA